MMLWQSRQMSVGDSSDSSEPQILQYRVISFPLISRNGGFVSWLQVEFEEWDAGEVLSILREV